MSNLKGQLRNLDVSKLKMKKGSTVEAELKRHAEILADCIMECLNEVYDSYTPRTYIRSYGLYNSLYIDDVVRVDISSSGVNLGITLHFDDGAIHKSFDGEDMNTAVLINEGWKTQGSFADVPMLGWKTGEHFVENGIEKYKRKVSNPFKVRFTINDEERIF